MLFLISLPNKREVTCRDSILQYPESPDVCRGSEVLFLHNDLRTHIVWRPTKEIQLTWILLPYTKAEVKESLMLLIIDKYVLCFKVSMVDAVFMAIIYTRHQLPEYMPGVSFCLTLIPLFLAVAA